MTPDPVALSKEESSIYSEGWHDGYVAAAEFRDQRIKELTAALQDLYDWGPGPSRENLESPALHSWNKAYEVLWGPMGR